MRFDRGSTRPSPLLDPIRIEFYGSVGPGPRPVTDPPRGAVPTGRGSGGVLAIAFAVALVIAVVAAAALELADGPATRPVSSGLSAVVPEPPLLERLPPAVASTLPFPGGAVPPGRYETDLLGLPIEFTVGEATALRNARSGTIVLTPVGSSPTSIAGEPHVQLIRLAGWNTAEEAADRRFRGVGSIAPDDIERWIADNDLIVDNRTSTRIDGRDTRVLDVRVDPTSPIGNDACTPESRPCFWFASVAAELIPHPAIRLDYALYGQMTMRLWLVTIPGEDPVLIEAAAPVGTESWFDDFEATTIETMVIGETAVEMLAGSGSGIPAPR